MHTALFDYFLAKKLIAQKPLTKRDSSRLLLINRVKNNFKDHVFSDLLQIIDKNYVLVFNNTKVFPASLRARKTTGGQVKILLIRELQPGIWSAFSCPGLKKEQIINLLKPHQKISKAGKNSDFCFQAVQPNNSQGLCKLKYLGNPKKFSAVIKSLGAVPLPPYIKAKNPNLFTEKYQTVYAAKTGSCAAPTAGFHFTKKLIKSLQNKEIEHYFVTLHVGLGTFRPVKHSLIQNHQMHSEFYEVNQQTLDKLKKAKKCGKKILAVGTTTARVLETVAGNEVTCGETNIFIYPGYKFKFVDALITNFHLPKSTLLMLVSAFVSFPTYPTLPTFTNFRESLAGQAYQHAIANGYRFYSFGDAMLII